MKFHILTLFPELFPGPLHAGVIGKALDNGLIKLTLHNPRDFTHDRHRSVDDLPYGGGPGMIMKPEPVFECLDNLGTPRPHTILLSPQGKLWHQKMAVDLAQNHSELAIICGRYEGVDERIREFASDIDISVGDYVLSGGEVAAMILVETISRLLPGVVGDKQSVEGDTLSENLLKYPQYTRPREYRGHEVPEILLSGHHEKIDEWRRKQAYKRTKARRPDLLGCKRSLINDMKLQYFVERDKRDESER